MGKGSVNIPPPPGLSDAEKRLIKKQTQSLDFYISSLEESKAQNKEQGLLMAVTSGLYNPVYEDGKLVDAVLDPAKVTELQGFYARNTELQTLAADRYERALKGELPVSEGTLARKEQDFKLLKEAAARRGVTIAGDNLEEAALTPQDSTAGNELVSRLNRTYRIAEDSERRGELSANPGTLGAATLTAASGAVSRFDPQGYLGAVQGAGYIQQPFAQQRELGYQATLNQASLRSSDRASTYQAIGQGLGAATSIAALTLSDGRLKEDVVMMADPLERVKQLNGVTFRWKSDPKNINGGLIAQDVERVLPEAVRFNDEGMRMVDYTAVIGLLVESVKALTAKVAELQMHPQEA